jgi:redox-sensitive bicupin YhaK (pirin superfamily)
LEHKDSIGTGSVIRAGDLQRMTAGTGIVHSEFNASKSEPVHLLQTWIFPDQRALKPSYDQKNFAATDRSGQLKLVASKDGRDGSISFHQDASLYAVALEPGQKVKHELAAGRAAWVQVATGAIALNGRKLVAGDGAAIEDESQLELIGVVSGETLLFDLR